MAEAPSPATRCHCCDTELVPYLHHVRDWLTGDEFSIDRCPECELGHTSPVPEDLEWYYGPAYYGNRHGLTARLCNWRRCRLLDRAARCRQGRLLDVGCGDGSFLISAQDRGWSVLGTELHPENAQMAGLDVRRTLDEIDHADGPFDVITLWHVLEHLPSPRDTLLQLQSLLDDSGILLIAVPNSTGSQAQTFGRHWLHLDVPRHLFHFGPKSMEKLLSETDFVIDQVWHGELEYDLLGYSQSLLNSLSVEQNMLFKILTGKATEMNHWSRLGHLMIGSAAIAIGILPTFLGIWLGSPGTLIVAAAPQRNKVN